MRETCSRSNLRSSTRVLPKVGLSFRAIRCSVRDVTMMSSMCVAGMRETDPTDAVFQETTAGDLVRSQLLGDSRYRTGCPPPSHRTSLDPESGTGVSNAATERQNRPIWPMFAGRDHANQRLWRACCSQARLGLVRVVVENHSSGYPAVRICRRQCSPSDTSRSLFPQKTVPSRNSSLIVKTPSA